MKILIVYWSTTWNTQTVAEHIETELSWAGHDVWLYSWAEVWPDEIKNYDLSFIGSSTWWDGEIQDDMIEFNDNIASTDLAWSKVAVFALWMSSFPQFCHAWVLIETALKESWSEVVNEMFQIDWDVWDVLDDVSVWAKACIDKS